MQYIALLILALIQIVICLLLFIKIRSSIARKVLIFNFVVFLWIITNIVIDYIYSGTGRSYDIELIEFINKIGYSLGIILIMMVYGFMSIFSHQLNNIKSKKLINISGVILAVAAFSTLLSGSFSYSNNDTLTYSYGLLIILIPIYFFIVTIITVKDALRIIRLSSNINVKKQAKIMIGGLIGTGIYALLFIIILPILFYNVSLTIIGYFAPFIFTSSLLYSILKLRFLDFRLMALRAVVYVLTFSAVFLFYLIISIILANKYLSIDLSIYQQLIFGIMSAFIAFLLQPIKKYFDKLTNNYFFRDAYNSQDVINEINSVLVTTKDLQLLLKNTATIIGSNLKSTYCEFYIDASATIDFHIAGTNSVLFAKPQWQKLIAYSTQSNTKVISIYDKEIPDDTKDILRDLDIELILRMSSVGQAVGSIIIGPKKSGNEYSYIDIQLLEIVADEVAIAVQNALRFEEISQFANTLEQKVEDATKELQQTNEKLRSLDEAKDEFISMASHQLRTPLTSVKGYISMVLEGDAGKISDTQKQYLNQAFVSSQRMVYLIADLLNVSRLKTGKFVIESSPVYLPNVVESELEQLYETAAARGLELVYNKPNSFVTLNLDETKIRQVIMNFVDNAIYYTPRGGRITIALKQLKNSIEYTVTDTGIGVPKKEQHHLFTKFYRAGNAKKARPDGTGLGLYMAKKVVVAQGGAIIFKTTEGKGSTFGFSFPIPEEKNSLH